MMKNKITIGSRGSELALVQSKYVRELINKIYPDIEIEIKVITTSGDKDLVSNWNNSTVSLKSFFTKEIEKELLEGTIDIAVHSMKDMPSVSPAGLVFGATPEREDNRDVVVSVKGKKLFDLKKGDVIGTSSLRRTVAIRERSPEVTIKPIRGNIHTRLEKLKSGEYDAIILAAAGLKRVGLEKEITEYLDVDVCMPAPAQGALYIQCRENDNEILNILSKIHNKDVAELVAIEREFSKIFDGGCHTPMGCYAQKINDTEINLKGTYYHEGRLYKEEITANQKQGVEIARELANKIKGRIENYVKD